MTDNFNAIGQPGASSPDCGCSGGTSCPGCSPFHGLDGPGTGIPRNKFYITLPQFSDPFLNFNGCFQVTFQGSYTSTEAPDSFWDGDVEVPSGQTCCWWSNAPSPGDLTSVPATPDDWPAGVLGTPSVPRIDLFMGSNKAAPEAGDPVYVTVVAWDKANSYMVVYGAWSAFPGGIGFDTPSASLPGFAAALAGTLQTSVTSLSLGTFDSLAGGCILVAIACDSGHVTGVSDDAGNTYSPAGAFAGNWAKIELWVAFNTAAHSGATVTASLSATTNAVGGVSVYTNTDVAVMELEVSNSKTSTATSITSPNFSPAEADTVAISFGFNKNTSQSYSAGSGYTLRDSSGYMGIEDRFNLPVALQSSTISISAPDLLDIVTVVLKPKSVSSAIGFPDCNIPKTSIPLLSSGSMLFCGATALWTSPCLPPYTVGDVGIGLCLISGSGCSTFGCAGCPGTSYANNLNITNLLEFSGSLSTVSLFSGVFANGLQFREEADFLESLNGFDAWTCGTTLTKQPQPSLKFCYWECCGAIQVPSSIDPEIMLTLPVKMVAVIGKNAADGPSYLTLFWQVPTTAPAIGGAGGYQALTIFAGTPIVDTGGGVFAFDADAPTAVIIDDCTNFLDETVAPWYAYMAADTDDAADTLAGLSGGFRVASSDVAHGTPCGVASEKVDVTDCCSGITKTVWTKIFYADRVVQALDGHCYTMSAATGEPTETMNLVTVFDDCSDCISYCGCGVPITFLKVILPDICLVFTKETDQCVWEQFGQTLFIPAVADCGLDLQDKNNSNTIASASFMESGPVACSLLGIFFQMGWRVRGNRLTVELQWQFSTSSVPNFYLRYTGTVPDGACTGSGDPNIGGAIPVTLQYGFINNVVSGGFFDSNTLTTALFTPTGLPGEIPGEVTLTPDPSSSAYSFNAYFELEDDCIS